VGDRRAKLQVTSTEALFGTDAAAGCGSGERIIGFAAKAVPVEVTRLSAGPSLRATPLHRDHIEGLVATGGDWPPLVVQKRGLVVIDGMHRLAAAVLLSLRTVEAVLFDGSPDEGFVAAIRCNVTHGLPLTLRERKQAARQLLAVRAEWSDRRVARTCGLSPSTVKQLRESTQARQVGAIVQLTRRVGCDGKPRPIRPAELRGEIAQAVTQDPTASLRAIAARTGASPTTVQTVRQTLRRSTSSGPPDGAVTPKTWSADSACASADDARLFALWFDRTAVDPVLSQRHAGNVPLSRVYEVADEASRRAKFWSAFAELVTKRVTGCQ
jgi:ParB-like chromosome segregation protein Spo0J